jgi:uncharacterized pyridoxamine 5'-phosphate oxidase family protein
MEMKEDIDSGHHLTHGMYTTPTHPKYEVFYLTKKPLEVTHLGIQNTL